MANEIKQADLDRFFGQRMPAAYQEARYERIQAKAKELAELILLETPVCADQTSSIRKLRDSLCWAREAILCGSKLDS